MLVNKDVPGYSLRFDIRNEVDGSDQIVIDEMFDENVYDIHDDTFATNQMMVDIGANIGAASILAYTKGAVDILAFEPEKHNYKQLEKNIKLNHLEDVITPIKLAVSDRIGETQIFDGQGGSFIAGANGVSQEMRDSFAQKKKESVKTTTLDEILAEIDEIALLKVDCEGGEYMIIESASLDALKKCQRIVMEYHQTDEATFGKMVAKLSLVFNLRVFGHYNSNGGQIDGHRY